MTHLPDDGLQPPCLYCDEPCAVDPDGHAYEWCSGHLLTQSEPHERAQPDPDAAHDSRVSQLLADEARRGAA